MHGYTQAEALTIAAMPIELAAIEKQLDQFAEVLLISALPSAAKQIAEWRVRQARQSWHHVGRVLEAYTQSAIAQIQTTESPHFPPILSQESESESES